jgi:hypothetical protein
LPDGLEVQTSEPRDVAPLVSGVVAKVGALSPSRTIELVASVPKRRWMGSHWGSTSPSAS